MCLIALTNLGFKKMSNELQVLEQNSNVIVEAYRVEGGAQSLFDRIAEQVRSVVPDLSTDKGRKSIASMARKVASSKTAFDAHGKELKEQYTVITSKIDADRKLFRDQCDALRDEIRQPLTDWENAEKERVAKHEAFVNEISMYASNCIENQYTSSQVNGAIARLESVTIDSSLEEFQDKATLAKYKMLDELKILSIQILKHEQHEAFLEKQRIEEQQRIQQERDAKIAREATEKAQREAEEKARLEADRVQREKAESEQREALLIAEKEAAVLREQQAKERAEAAAIQAEHNKQQAIEAERKRIEAEQLAKAEAERKALEAREADKEHKKKVCDDVLVAFEKLGIGEDLGKSIIKAIHKGEIPNISIKF